MRALGSSGKLDLWAVFFWTSWVQKKKKKRSHTIFRALVHYKQEFETRRFFAIASTEFEQRRQSEESVAWSWAFDMRLDMESAYKGEQSKSQRKCWRLGYLFWAQVSSELHLVSAAVREPCREQVRELADDGKHAPTAWWEICLMRQERWPTGNCFCALSPLLYSCQSYGSSSSVPFRIKTW